MQKSCKWYRWRDMTEQSVSLEETPSMSRLVKADCVRRLGAAAFGPSCRQGGAGGCVATSLVSLHVAADAEGFAASGLWALVRLLARVAVAVYAQATGARKGLVAGGANVAVLWLWEL